MAKTVKNTESKIYFRFNQRSDIWGSYDGMIAEVTADDLKRLEGLGEVVTFDNEVKSNGTTE